MNTNRTETWVSEAEDRSLLVNRVKLGKFSTCQTSFKNFCHVPAAATGLPGHDVVGHFLNGSWPCSGTVGTLLRLCSEMYILLQWVEIILPIQ